MQTVIEILTHGFSIQIYIIYNVAVTFTTIWSSLGLVKSFDPSPRVASHYPIEVR
jgi:hypothetical protein